MRFDVALHGRIVDGSSHVSPVQSLAPQRFENIFVFAKSVKHHNHRSALPRQLINVYIINKSFPALLKSSAMPDNVPGIEQAIAFGNTVALDSPLLIKEYIGPKLASAECKKLKSHALSSPYLFIGFYFPIPL